MLIVNIINAVNDGDYRESKNCVNYILKKLQHKEQLTNTRQDMD